MPVVTLTEYLEVAGVPLATPAWVHEDLADLYSLAPMEYANVRARHHDGEQPRRGRHAARAVSIPMLIRGGLDSDGLTPYASSLEGLRANLDELAALMPADDVTTLLRHHLADGSVREAPCQVQGLQVGFAGPNDLRATLELLIPGAVLRSSILTSRTDPAQSITRNVDVTNGGTALQLASTITLGGTATSVTLTNLTMTSQPAITVTANLSSGNVVLDTDRWSALQGATRVPVLHTGFPRWLPLLPGLNNIQVAPSGGTASFELSHYAPYR